ncbi:toll/interleukin-1 receptor domain-containing protein [Wukongibacter sp. M2B1]|uniref:toll/interleukin-1 receptor domain-containing protein n=1 Tax=Wukongibacter sp. M2B1 TaxID=3088895 RepID=UPI003D78D428
MTNIFLSHSSNDKERFVSLVAEELKRNPKYYTIWYYDRLLEGCNYPMDIFLEKLHQTDLFVVFISHDSLSSSFVKREIDLAIELHKNGIISEILPLIIDPNLNPNLDNRIPNYLKKDKLIYVNTPKNAILLIEEYCSNL